MNQNKSGKNIGVFSNEKPNCEPPKPCVNQNKSIEQAAEKYAYTKVSSKQNHNFHYAEQGYIAGAKHQKLISESREKLLMDAIDEMQMSLEYYRNLKKEYLSLGGVFNPELMTLSDKALQDIFNPAIRTLSSVAKKLEGL